MNMLLILVLSAIQIPLYVAIETLDEDAVSFLLEKGSIFNSEYEYTDAINWLKKKDDKRAKNIIKLLEKNLKS